MKPTSTQKIAIALFTCVALAGTASAQVIGVDFFTDSTNTGAPNYLPNNDSTNQIPGGTAVVGPYASAGWNNEYNTYNMPAQYPVGTNPYNPTYGGSGATLVDSNGNTTTATFGMNPGLSNLDGTSAYAPYYGANGSNNSALTPNQQLYNGETNSAGGNSNQQVSLMNVPYSSYNVYLLVLTNGAAGNGSVSDWTNAGTTTTATLGTTYYFSSNVDAGTSIPASTFSYLQASSTDSTNPTLNANYVEFTGLTSADVAFDIDSISQSYNGGAYLGGIEIVDNAVPEPSTYAMMLGGLGLLAFVVRRRLAS